MAVWLGTHPQETNGVTATELWPTLWFGTCPWCAGHGEEIVTVFVAYVVTRARVQSGTVSGRLSSEQSTERC